MEWKKWYKSKTLIANILLVVGGICTAIAGEITTGVPITVIGVVNIALRLVTKTAIE